MAKDKKTIPETDPAPADNTPAPPVNTPAPADNTPAPPVNTPAPADNTPAPPENTPAPPEIKLNGELPPGIPPINLNPTPEIPISELNTEIPPPGSPENTVKRGRGRPPGSKTRPADGSGSPTPPSIGAGVDAEKLFSGMAAMTFDIGSGTLVNLLGAEWNPKTPEERNFVVGAIAGYYRETGVKEISPKMLLLIALATYSLPRFAEPNTRDKIKMAFLWAKTKIAGALTFFKSKK